MAVSDIHDFAFNTAGRINVSVDGRTFDEDQLQVRKDSVPLEAVSLEAVSSEAVPLEAVPSARNYSLFRCNNQGILFFFLSHILTRSATAQIVLH